MGFSIGGFLGSIAPALGGIFGGPVGAAIGTAVGAGLAPKPRPQAVVGRQITPVMQTPAALTSVVPVPVNFPQRQAFRAPGTEGFGVQRRRVSTGTSADVGDFGVRRRRVGVMTQFGRAVGIGGGPVSEILADARVFTGGSVTKNKIIAAAKVCGIDVAATTFGITDQDVCLVIVAGRTRRRRGISAADIRRTKRTLGFVKRIRSDLKSIRL